MFINNVENVLFESAKNDLKNNSSSKVEINKTLFINEKCIICQKNKGALSYKNKKLCQNCLELIKQM